MRQLLYQLSRLPQNMLVVLVKTYRLLLSPWLGTQCRFEPTCSIYSLQALQIHGAAIGSYLTLHRLARCHPWCNGGIDVVPQKFASSLFSRLVAPADSTLSKKTMK